MCLRSGLFIFYLLLSCECGSTTTTTAIPVEDEFEAQRQFLAYNQYSVPDFSTPPSTLQGPDFVVIGAKPFSVVEQVDSMALQPAFESETVLGALGTERKPNKKKKKKGVKKKRKGGNGNKKKKKKEKRKKKKQEKPEQHHLIGQTAHVIFAEPPQHHYKPPKQQPPATTTMAPYKKKIKYILRKHNSLKKIKKEYFSHLGHVIYPFVKFVVFFTVLNPFTFGVFFFSLISPIVFGILGFLALSFVIKPVLHLLFDVKRNVGVIDRKRWYEKRRRERIRDSRRPITIHKHYYQHRDGGSRQSIHRRDDVRDDDDEHKRFNPILPNVRNSIEIGDMPVGGPMPQYLQRRQRFRPP